MDISSNTLFSVATLVLGGAFLIVVLAQVRFLYVASSPAHPTIHADLSAIYRSFELFVITGVFLPIVTLVTFVDSQLKATASLGDMATIDHLNMTLTLIASSIWNAVTLKPLSWHAFAASDVSTSIPASVHLALSLLEAEVMFLLVTTPLMVLLAVRAWARHS